MFLTESYLKRYEGRPVKKTRSLAALSAAAPGTEAEDGMFELLTLTALAVGQVPGGTDLAPPPNWPPYNNALPASKATPAWSLNPPPPMPAKTPSLAPTPVPASAAPTVTPVAMQSTETPVPKAQEFTAAVLPKPAEPALAEDAEVEAEAAPDRWFLMRELQGTWLGMVLDDNRTSISGWIEGSYTGSTAELTNVPMVWNDRPNNFLLQQAWVRVERSVVTSGTTPTWGYRADILTGTDYRFSLQRGVFNSQLINTKPGNFQDRQNLYGVDPIQFYTNVYIPTLFQGVDIRAGRLYTPFGYESLEAVSTPLLSRSYAFNWCPPFTHMGVMASINFNSNWVGKFMLANGNDVFIDPAQEARFVGAVTWTSNSKNDAVTFGTSIGRGKFNAGDPFAPITAGLMSEDNGRNNINVFDLVWTHVINSRLGYAVEVIYGYQNNVPTTTNVANRNQAAADAAAAAGLPAPVPTTVVGAIISDNPASGTAHWGSVCQYLNYTFTDKLTGVARFELFDDFEGQRTTFEGLYTAVTLGLQYRPTKSIIIRPEIRYDYNGDSRPYNPGNDGVGTRHDLFTASSDIIFRY